MVENMQSLTIAGNRKGSLFPQNIEEGYNVMKQMQQVLRRVFTGSRFKIHGPNLLIGIPEHRPIGQGRGTTVQHSPRKHS